MASSFPSSHYPNNNNNNKCTDSLSLANCTCNRGVSNIIASHVTVPFFYIYEDVCNGSCLSVSRAKTLTLDTERKVPVIC